VTLKERKNKKMFFLDIVSLPFRLLLAPEEVASSLKRPSFQRAAHTLTLLLLFATPFLLFVAPSAATLTALPPVGILSIAVFVALLLLGTFRVPGPVALQLLACVVLLAYWTADVLYASSNLYALVATVVLLAASLALFLSLSSSHSSAKAASVSLLTLTAATFYGSSIVQIVLRPNTSLFVPVVEGALVAWLALVSSDLISVFGLVGCCLMISLACKTGFFVFAAALSVILVLVYLRPYESVLRAMPALRPIDKTTVRVAIACLVAFDLVLLDRFRYLPRALAYFGVVPPVPAHEEAFLYPSSAASSSGMNVSGWVDAMIAKQGISSAATILSVPLLAMLMLLEVAPTAAIGCVVGGFGYALLARNAVAAVLTMHAKKYLTVLLMRMNMPHPSIVSLTDDSVVLGLIVLVSTSLFMWAVSRISKEVHRRAQLTVVGTLQSQTQILSRLENVLAFGAATLVLWTHFMSSLPTDSAVYRAVTDPMLAFAAGAVSVLVFFGVASAFANATIRRLAGKGSVFDGVVSLAFVGSFVGALYFLVGYPLQ
jgi:hypothetical protein